MFGISSRYEIEPFSKYIFDGTLNHCILTLLLNTLFIFIRLLTETLSVVEFLPFEPHPRVRDGVAQLYMSPIAPWEDGEFTIILPASIISPNFSIICSFCEWITAV